MPEPTTVWLVRAGSVEGVRGRIELDAAGISFTPDGQDEPSLHIGRHDVADVRRLRGTPVMRLTRNDEETLLIYFSEPPPLRAQRRTTRIGLGRGIERTTAGMSLRAAAGLHRPTVDRWVRAIRG